MSTWKPETLGLPAPLGVIAFWVGMVIAAWRYPTEYDWRYLTISNLVFPDRNPAGHLWARLGIVLCGVGLLCWVSAPRSALHDSRARPLGVWALRLAGASMACCAALPEGLSSVPRVHEVLALTAFFSLCLALMHLTYHAVAPQLRALGVRDCKRILAVALAGAAFAPIMLASVAQTYVSNELPELPWVNLSWRTRGIPCWLSFAYWEWLTCVIFSVYLCALSVAHALHRHPRTAAP